MKKYKQCLYTVILILTCFIASPYIFIKIWSSSESVEKESISKPPSVAAIALTTTAAPITEPATVTAEPTTAAMTTDAEETPASETAAAVTTTEVTVTTTEAVTTTQPPAQYVQGDPSYFDDALFIGDSRTVGISEYGTLQNADYFCNTGLAPSKILDEKVSGKTLADTLAGKKYGKIYLMIGINEVGNPYDNTTADIEKAVSAIREAQPEALIFLEANLHVTKSAQSNAITNERINELNARIAALADGRTTFYIDVNPLFDDDKGNLRDDCTSDGVHVLAKYYQTWCEWLCAMEVNL